MFDIENPIFGKKVQALEVLFMGLNKNYQHRYHLMV